MQRYRFIDLFAGCGGLSLGLTLANMQGCFAVERDPMAFRTFESNFLERDTPVAKFQWPKEWLAQKAWDIDELLRKHRAELEGLREAVEVLAGGPPCQGFSFAGRRNEEDPRNLLFKKYVECVDAIRPQVLVLENVPGMRVLHARGGPSADVERRTFFERLVDSLGAVGYVARAKLLDASRFGVPQRRSRLIVIGIREDLLDYVEDGITGVFDRIERSRVAQLRELGLGDEVSAADAISDLETLKRTMVACTDPASKPGFSEVQYEAPASRYQQLMNDGCTGQPNSMRLAQHRQDVRDRFQRIISECRKGVRMDDESRLTFGLRKHRIYPMDGSVPAPTVTTLPDDILHYSEPRILTVRECARLQSFPDWFEFAGKFTTGGNRRTQECPRYTQVGNAVPPYLARAIGHAVVGMLDEIRIGRDYWESRSGVARLAVGA